MKSLLIENSTANGTVAVADEEEILIRRVFSKTGELAVKIQEIFLRLGDPDEIVVGIGPGSYTGLRVASATADDWHRLGRDYVEHTAGFNLEPEDRLGQV